MRNILKIVFVAFVLMSSTKKTTHESVSATFNVIERGYVLLLEIDFDEENYIKFGNANGLKVTKDDFDEYLKETTSWEFDGEQLSPQILSIKTNHEHTKVICFLSKVKKNIKTIKVKNEFLIDVEDHSNIIKLDLNNSFKDFRMHKGRKELKVVYNVD